MSMQSRRGFLRTVAGGGVVGLSGCLDDQTVSVLSAGSLAVVLEDHLGQAFADEHGIAFRGEYYGANAVMRMVEDGQKHPDVVISADNVLLRDRLYESHTDWDVEFASNSVGLAYNPDSEFGRRLENDEPWYELAETVDDGELAISDPDLDPLGYRAMLAFELAEAEYGLEGFVEQLSEAVYREPEEPQLLAGLEAGNRAAAVSYRNMAVDHGLPFVEFPDSYNFANPDYEDHYASVSYTTDEGYTADGNAIIYNATVIDRADNPDAGRSFVRFLAEAEQLLAENGLTVEGFPNNHGAVPDEIQQ